MSRPPSKLAVVERAIAQRHGSFYLLVLPTEFGRVPSRDGSPWRIIPGRSHAIYAIHADDLAERVLEAADREALGLPVGDLETVMIRKLAPPDMLAEAARIAHNSRGVIS